MCDGLETSFLTVLADAAKLPEHYEAAKIAKERVAADEYPLIVLHKLEMSARAHLRAGLALLRTPSLSYAGVAHSRILVEYMAHALWICGRDGAPPGDPATRAVCFEFGSAKQFANKVTSRPPTWNATSDGGVRVEAWRADIRERHHALGCGCKGRGPGNVPGSLQALAKADGDHYLYTDIYDTGSMFLHLQLPELMLGSTDGISSWAPAPLHFRAYQLMALVDTYSQGVAVTLDIQGSGHTANFRLAVQRVLEPQRLLPFFPSPPESIVSKSDRGFSPS